MTNSKPRRFGDIENPFDGVADQRIIDDILDKDVEIIDYAALDGQFGEYYNVLARDVKSGKEFTFNTGSEVLKRKFARAKKEGYLPLVGTISRPGRYYTIS